ncbi:unnamed protein product, partial [Rotaria sp. Silwood1]
MKEFLEKQRYFIKDLLGFIYLMGIYWDLLAASGFSCT